MSPSAAPYRPSTVLSPSPERHLVVTPPCLVTSTNAVYPELSAALAKPPSSCVADIGGPFSFPIPLRPLTAVPLLGSPFQPSMPAPLFWPWPFPCRGFSPLLPNFFPSSATLFGMNSPTSWTPPDTTLCRDGDSRSSVGGPMKEKRFKCQKCEKSYSSNPALHMHMRTHLNGCSCPMCGKPFSRHWLLQGHMRTHTGEKPFKCPACGKAFADKSNMRAHTQTHSGAKPHLCSRCGKAFALKSYLAKHQESACVRTEAAVASTVGLPVALSLPISMRC